MIGVEALARIGEDGYLIIIAQGELIENEAPEGVLRDETIAGAALDVFVEEPLSERVPLTDLDSVILGSHNSQNIREVVERIGDRTADNPISGLIDRLQSVRHVTVGQTMQDWHRPGSDSGHSGFSEEAERAFRGK